MNDLEDVYRHVIRDLERIDHDVALVGGLAVSARAGARFTADIDLAVMVSGDTDAELLVRHLITSGYRVVMMIEQDDTGRLATARLVPREFDELDVVVDLLFATAGVEPEIVAHATMEEVWPGVRGRVARVGHLIALKLLSQAPQRPQDHVDLVNLLLVADAEERALAYAAARLIEQRGFARGRNLCVDLDALIKELEL